MLLLALTNHNNAFTLSKDDKYVKSSGRWITQLAKMSTDPKLVELTADVFTTLLNEGSSVTDDKSITRKKTEKDDMRRFQIPQLLHIETSFSTGCVGIRPRPLLAPVS